MSNNVVSAPPATPLLPTVGTQPIVALDFPDARETVAFLERVPDADFVKVGLQLFTAEGPEIVRTLRDMGRRVFLDLKLHDIPNTVAHAVESAARLGVDLLTVHASGGRTMLRAARSAAGPQGGGGPRLLAVTVLTSLDEEGLGEAWGRTGLDTKAEVVRLAELAEEAGMDGVVASVHETEAIRASIGGPFLVLTPGIRLPGDAAGDQSRVASPAQAARLGADFLVVGRSVTGAADPVHAYRRVVESIEAGRAEGEA